MGPYGQESNAEYGDDTIVNPCDIINIMYSMSLNNTLYGCYHIAV